MGIKVIVDFEATISKVGEGVGILHGLLGKGIDSNIQFDFVDKQLDEISRLRKRFQQEDSTDLRKIAVNIALLIAGLQDHLTQQIPEDVFEQRIQDLSPNEQSNLCEVRTEIFSALDSLTQIYPL